MKVTLVAAALLLAPSSAAAQQNAMTGAGLLQVCTIPEMTWIDFCHGYMQAVVDATDGDLACIPEGRTRASITSEVVEHMLRAMASASSLHDLNAFAVVNAVMQRLYPCNG